ncbi:hypothetical protein HOLleu_13661 [Holothuria leucospilota]|uniref:RNA-directed DNA polymerase from mobile element jockey n=1 Tax=Holothuria leucospilota TaxID=206669 RepID=A0A9Q1H8F7_HOLLE|nr:hypothetical protein HOLleu_13661 [Holothuria leucospilota]
MRVSPKANPNPYFYQMGNHTLEQVKHHPYLGVELSSSMNWKRHINQVVSKANRTLGLLRRNLSHCDKDTKTAAYFVLVRPILDYCSTVWAPIPNPIRIL